MAKTKEKPTVQYVHNGTGFDEVELPIDLSENGFKERLRAIIPRIDSDTVGRALDHMKNENVKKHSSIYESIYNNPIRDSNSSVTKPRTFHYETLELLEAITIAYHSREKTDSNEMIANRSLSKLGEMLAKKQPEMLDNDYPATVMLNNRDVQRSMNLHFDEELRKRMVSVWELLHRAKPEKLPELMVHAIKHLDYILAVLCEEDSQENKQQPHKSSHVKAIQNLHKELMTPRNSIRKPYSDKNSDLALHFQLPETDENKELLTGMESLLSKEARVFSKSERQDFLHMYTEYLKTSLGKKYRSGNAASFLSNYQALEEYIRGQSSEKEFQDQVRSDLYRYAKGLFVYIPGGSVSMQSRFDPVFTHSSSTFAHSRMMAFTQKIDTMFRDAFQWMRSAQNVSWLFCLADMNGTPDNNSPYKTEQKDIAIWYFCKQITNIFLNLKNIRECLHKHFKDVPLLQNYEDDTLKRFVTARNEIGVKHFGEDPISFEQEKVLIDTYVLQPRTLTLDHMLRRMGLEEKYLCQELQLILSAMIEAEVSEISKQRKIYEDIM